MWLMALAFESIQPTKPLALAVGPVGAGKSHVFRRVGQLLLGSRFELDMLRRDKEDDFFVAITNKPFVVFDNVDQRIPWLNDSLASTATGGGVTKKVLYTTNEMAFYVPRAFIALTARTPRFRREDVAERLVIFHLDKLVEKRPEYILLKEIEDQREALLSDWVQMLNRIVAQPMPASQWTTIRLADFAHIALRVAAALGFDDEAAEVLDKLKRAQYIFATEESELYLVLDAWIDKPVQAGLLNETNAGRFVHTKKLLEELRLAATDSGIRCNITSAVQLGRLLKQLREALGVHFDITDQHREGGTSWCFKRI